MKLLNFSAYKNLLSTLVLLTIPFSAIAQNETIKNIAQLDTVKNPVTEKVNAESVLDAKLQALAEREKHLQERLITNDEVSVKPKEVVNVNNQKTELKDSSIAPDKIIPLSSDSNVAKVSTPEKKVEIKKEELKKDEPKKETIEESSSQKELALANTKIQKLLKELDETKSRLIISETEVERLASLLESKNVSQLEQMNVTSPQKARVEMKNIRPLADIEPMIGEKATKDIPLATVIAPQVSLKLGPSLQSSTLTQVTEGTKLPVEGSQGSWYRVVSPSGARAWIPAHSVTLGKKVSELKEELGMDDAAYSAFKTMGKNQNPEVE